MECSRKFSKDFQRLPVICLPPSFPCDIGSRRFPPLFDLSIFLPMDVPQISFQPRWWLDSIVGCWIQTRLPCPSLEMGFQSPAGRCGASLIFFNQFSILKIFHPILPTGSIMDDLEKFFLEPERVATPRKAVSFPIFFSKTSTPLLCFTLFQPELAKLCELMVNEMKKRTRMAFTCETIERKNQNSARHKPNQSGD